MKWTKVSIQTITQDLDVLTGILADLGIVGVELVDPQDKETFLKNSSIYWDYVDDIILNKISDDAFIIFYTGTDVTSHNMLSQLQQQLSHLAVTPKITTTLVDDDTWLHEWKKYFHPIKIGNVLIIPEWDKSCYESEVIFTIDPGSAFGTGQHATTMLCIEALQKYIKQDINVLDVGCGSGILSIISLLLGAGSVTACDIDPLAIEITEKNAQLNSISFDKLNLHVGDILTNKDLLRNITFNGAVKHKYNIIVANIVADVIINFAPIIRDNLSEGGHFISSGIIDSRINDVITTLETFGYTIVETQISDGWCCVVAI